MLCTGGEGHLFKMALLIWSTWSSWSGVLLCMCHPLTVTVIGLILNIGVIILLLIVIVNSYTHTVNIRLVVVRNPYSYRNLLVLDIYPISHYSK